jgi:selenocysteine lyase/cysteine desulfurase
VLVHAVGGLCFVDGVHYTPHALPDVRALACDAFVCSPYKFYGPHLGVLWVRRDLLAETPFPKLAPASDEPPERGETGTLNHEGIVGAAAAVEWLAALAAGNDGLRTRLRATFDALHARGAALLRALWDSIATIPGIQAFGPPPGAPRTPTVSFVVEGVPSERVARALADRAVFASHGDFYAQTLVARLGQQPEGLVRAGCACYTTELEVVRLVDGLQALSRS